MPDFNIPGIFKMVQGVPPRTPRYGPVAPVAAPMAQGFDGGGTYNIPGYDGEEVMTPGEWTSTPGGGGGGGNAPGAPAEDAPADPSSVLYYLIATELDLVTPEGELDLARARDLYNSNPSYFNKQYGFGAESDSGLAGTYAQIAENARQWNDKMAFDRERAGQEDKVARWSAEMNRQQALSDFSAAQDAAKVARKSMFNDAATQAIQAHQSGLGQANIPGIEGWWMAGGAPSDAIIDRAPIVGFNPSLTYGEQLEAPAELYQPNIPGVNF